MNACVLQVNRSNKTIFFSFFVLLRFYYINPRCIVLGTNFLLFLELRFCNFAGATFFQKLYVLFIKDCIDYFISTTIHNSGSVFIRKKKKKLVSFWFCRGVRLSTLLRFSEFFSLVAFFFLLSFAFYLDRISPPSPSPLFFFFFFGVVFFSLWFFLGN